jgi:hypothetical protein
MDGDLEEPLVRERGYLEARFDEAVEQGSISEIATLLKELAAVATAAEDSPHDS